MMCPNCDNMKTYIDDAQDADDYSTRRRRKCPACGYRFTTYERPAQTGILKKRFTNTTERVTINT